MFSHIFNLVRFCRGSADCHWDLIPAETCIPVSHWHQEGHPANIAEKVSSSRLSHPSLSHPSICFVRILSINTD